MRAALLFLWLITPTPFAQAADWLGWRKVGDATLTWGPFTVYTSQLRTPEGRYTGKMQDQALIITYARDIDSEDLVEATRDQWRAQGFCSRNRRAKPGCKCLPRCGRMSGRGRSWRSCLTISKDSSGTARLAHRALSDPWGRLSRKRSAPVFWGSGLIPARNTLSCVSS